MKVSVNHTDEAFRRIPLGELLEGKPHDQFLRGGAGNGPNWIPRQPFTRQIGFDEIKTHLVGKTPTLRSQTPLGCLQEIYGLLIAHIAVRSLMYEAASKYDLDPDRLSFVDSVRVISRSIPRMQAAPTQLLPVHYEMMLDEIASHLLPPRRNRSNPRVVKQRIKKGISKRPEHYKPPPPRTRFEEAIYVLN